MTPSPSPDLAPEAPAPPTPVDPVAEQIAAVASLHARAENRVDPRQRRIEAFTEWLGRPKFLTVTLLAVGVWIAVNLLLRVSGLPRLDEPPFFWLQGAVGLSALLVASVVLITQNRLGKVATRREHLDLQMSMLTEHRTAKIIQLLEELRRDLPNVRDRADAEAEALSRTVDPEVMLTSLEFKLEEAVTERQRAEQIAEDARAYAQSVADTLGEPLVVLDAGSLRVLSANRAYHAAFGGEIGEGVGHSFYGLHGGAWNAPALHRFLEDIAPQDTAVHGTEIDGVFGALGRRVLLLTARRLTLPSGGAGELLLLGLRDDTARREEEERLRLLVEGARDYAMLMIDPEGRIAFWNEGAERILGWTSDEIIGQPYGVIFTPEDRDAKVPDDELFRAATRGKAEDIRWHLRRDGSRFYADGMVRPLHDGAGDLRGYGKVLRDTGEQRAAAAEASRQDAERERDAAEPEQVRL